MKNNLEDTKMARLHEILAVESSKKTLLAKLFDETKAKFGKSEFFQGFVRTLKMINDSPENAAIERSTADSRSLPTTVHETLAYVLQFFGEYEDIQIQKNATNQVAVADLMYKGEVLLTNLPVDQLLGLEDRFSNLRKTVELMPTLAASKEWLPNEDTGRLGEWKTKTSDITIKTEKIIDAKVLYPATDKHPAQIKEYSKDVPVGELTQLNFCGAATSKQKAEVLAIIDTLINEARQARMRANTTEVVNRRIGEVLVKLIMTPFTGA